MGNHGRSPRPTGSGWRPINDAPSFDFAQEVHVAQDSGAVFGSMGNEHRSGPARGRPNGQLRDRRQSSRSRTRTCSPSLLRSTTKGSSPLRRDSTNRVRHVLLARAKDDGGLEDWHVPNEYLTEPPDDTSDTIAFAIVVDDNPPNAAPVAEPDTKTVPQNAGPTSVDVLANDTDPDDDDLTITAVTQGAHGAVAITGGGAAVSYDPAGLYTGADSFTYTVNDGHGGTDTGSRDGHGRSGHRGADRGKPRALAPGASDRDVKRQGRPGLEGHRCRHRRLELSPRATDRHWLVDQGDPVELERDVGDHHPQPRYGLQLPSPRNGSSRQRGGVGGVPDAEPEADPGHQLVGEHTRGRGPRSPVRTCPAAAPGTPRPRPVGQRSPSPAGKSPGSRPGERAAVRHRS